MGCGLKATKDNFSCSSLNAFKEIRVSNRTIIKNDITIINDGQNICTIEYKKCIPGKKVFNLFQRVLTMLCDAGLRCVNAKSETDEK